MQVPSEKARKQMTKMPETTQAAQETKRRQEVYQQLVAERKPKPPYLRHFLVAFVTGGAVCALGQFVLGIFIGLSLIHI